MKIFVIILVFSPFILTAQSAAFKKISITEKLSDRVDTPIIYPLVALKNTLTADKINETIKKRIFWDENDKAKTATALLRRDRKERHLYISYGILFNQNGILSFDIILEASGAYSTSWYEYFNFDLNTGKELDLKDLIQSEKYESFKAEVFERKKDSVQKYLSDTKQRLDTG